jgi:small subunit ribosomal protein S13
MSSREFRHIVRLMGTDLDGTKKLVYGLSKIRGIGISFSTAVTRAVGLRPDIRIGQLSDEEVDKIEDVVSDPLKFGIPARLVNRRKDFETSRDVHLVGADLVLRQKADIDFMKDLRTWKGVRHSLGLKVRGQRTKTTGRSGKAVGVAKKAAIAALRAAQREKGGKE